MPSGEQDSSDSNQRNIFDVQPRKPGEGLFGVQPRKPGEPLFGRPTHGRQESIAESNARTENPRDKFKRQSDELLRRTYGHSLEELTGQSWESFSANKRKPRG